MRPVLAVPIAALLLGVVCGCSRQPGPDQTYKYGPPISPAFRDLAYADVSQAQKLDLYLPAKGGGPAPLVIWIHGGQFRVGDKGSMPAGRRGPPAILVRLARLVGVDGLYQIQVPDVAGLTARGYAVASLNYRLLNKPGEGFYSVALPAVQDGKAAVRYLRANASRYNIDPNRFAVWGNSAGGFIAAMLGVTGDQPTAFDDPALGPTGVSAAVQAVVVWYGSIDADYLRPEIRIFHYIPTAKAIPPFRIANGDADTGVTAAMAKRLNDALLKAGVKSTLTILPGAGHEDPSFMATQMPPTLEFLDEAFGRAGGPATAEHPQVRLKE